MSIDELKELQANIIEKNKKINRIAYPIVTAIIVMLLLLFIINQASIFLMFFIIIFVMIISLAIIMGTKSVILSKDIDIFDKEFKSIFVSKSLENTFENLVYNPDKGFDREYVNSMNFIDTADRFYSNDYISGTYKTIKFEQADVHIEEKREEKDSDGKTKTYYETIFMGRLMVFDFNKAFKSNVKIIGGFIEADKSFNTDYTQVKMEDVEFNDMFTVYAESELEAFYILTPHFMERLKNIKKELESDVVFFFQDNKLYVAIDNYNDAFEYNVYKPIDEEEIENNISKDIKLITSFVDELNLDNKLFRREV